MNFKEHYQRFRENCAQKFHRLISEEIVFQADAARSLREISYLFYSNAFMILFTVLSVLDLVMVCLIAESPAMRKAETKRGLEETRS